MKFDEKLIPDDEISRRIDWNPPQGPEIGQKIKISRTGSSNPFSTVPWEPLGAALGQKYQRRNIRGNMDLRKLMENFENL